MAEESQIKYRRRSSVINLKMVIITLLIVGIILMLCVAMAYTIPVLRSPSGYLCEYCRENDIIKPGTHKIYFGSPDDGDAHYYCNTHVLVVKKAIARSPLKQLCSHEGCFQPAVSSQNYGRTKSLVTLYSCENHLSKLPSTTYASRSKRGKWGESGPSIFSVCGTVAFLIIISISIIVKYARYDLSKNEEIAALAYATITSLIFII